MICVFSAVLELVEMKLLCYCYFEPKFNYSLFHKVVISFLVRAARRGQPSSRGISCPFYKSFTARWQSVFWSRCGGNIDGRTKIIIS